MYNKFMLVPDSLLQQSSYIVPIDSMRMLNVILVFTLFFFFVGRVFDLLLTDQPSFI